jgi:ribosomal protein S18 acetylase RimI-like enzyme
VPTAPCWHLRRDESLANTRFAAELRERLNAERLFVKPAAEDASLGIDDDSVATDWNSLARKTRDVQTRYGDVLIERYLDGREFNVGVIALPDPRTLPIAEIEFQANPELPWPVVTYKGKWVTSSEAFRATPVRCPAVVDAELKGRVEQAALAAFQATGCRDYARVDLRATSDGEVFVLEVNGNPDVGPSAGLARALLVAGIAYDDFVLQLVTAAAARTGRAKATAPLLPKRSQSHDAAPTDVRIRPLKETDKAALLELLAACEMFRPDEIEVADEILREAIRDGAASHYQVLVAEHGGVPVGWSCHGRVPLTDATYDLYWIAVHPDHQRRRIGRKLLDEIEASLRRAGTRWLLAETSGAPLYDKTRGFYERAGFSVVGDVPDFYRHGDGRITYGKRIE